MTAHWVTELTGSAAGFCTTVSLVPQLYQIWRTRSARDLSVAMFAVFGMGIALWLVFGIEVRSPAVIAANGASLVLVIAILTLAVRYQKSKIEWSHESRGHTHPVAAGARTGERGEPAAEPQRYHAG